MKKESKKELKSNTELGRELDLYLVSDIVGPGLPLLTPKGTTIKREIERFVQDEELNWGCASRIKKFIDLTKFKEPGPTMDARQKMKHDLRKKKRKVNF